MLRSGVRVVVSLAAISFLAGCTITGEPRMDRVAFDNEGYVVENEVYRNSISVGEISDFRGTSRFTYGGRLAPNFSNASFKEVLEKSLANASLKGEGYTLNAKLIDSGDWSDWFELSIGEKSRRTEIEYTLSKKGNVIFQETIVNDIAVRVSAMAPYNISQRQVAEVNYAKNIELLIEKINSM